MTLSELNQPNTKTPKFEQHQQDPGLQSLKTKVKGNFENDQKGWGGQTYRLF